MSDYGSTPPPPPPFTPSRGPGPVDHPNGVTILVLGIVGLVCFQPLGIAAWVMGNRALAEIDANPGAYRNRQIVQIGRILGIIASVFVIIGALWLVLFGGWVIISSVSS